MTLSFKKFTFLVCYYINIQQLAVTHILSFFYFIQEMHNNCKLKIIFKWFYNQKTQIYKNEKGPFYLFNNCFLILVNMFWNLSSVFKGKLVSQIVNSEVFFKLFVVQLLNKETVWMLWQLYMSYLSLLYFSFCFLVNRKKSKVLLRVSVSREKICSIISSLWFSAG